MKYLLVLVVLLIPQLSFAKSAPLTIQKVPRDQIASFCNMEIAPDMRLYGCFWGNKINKIFLDESLTGTDKEFVLDHEIGHYLLECADLTRFNGDKELAADRFGLSKVLPKMVSDGDKTFFEQASAGKYLCKGNKLPILFPQQ